MTKKEKQELKAYYKRIKEALPCGKETRDGIMFHIESAVGDYINSNPEVSVSEVIEHFGAPSSIASAYIESEDIKVTGKRMKSIVIVRIVAAVIIAVFAAIALFKICDYVHHVYLISQSYVVEEVR